MNIGKAVAICERLDSEEYSIEDKLIAVHEVMNMPTHMGVKKDTLIGMIKWLFDFHLEVNDSHRQKRIVEVPVPHGDLLDREELIADLNLRCPPDSPSYDLAYDLIEDAEAVIEAEEDKKPWNVSLRY